MKDENTLGKIVSRIRNQRFLFFIAVVVVSAALAPVSFWLPLAGFAFAFVLAVIERGFDYMENRNRFSQNAELASAFEVVVSFEGESDASQLRFTQCQCTIEDSQGKRPKKEQSLKPHLLGTAWLCPLPAELRPQDVIEISFLDNSGRKWMVGPIAYSHLWPSVKADPVK